MLNRDPISETRPETLLAHPKKIAFNVNATPPFRIGTAGWTLPRQHAHHFPPAIAANGEKLTHLQRCAAVFNCVEINSSFHRPHRVQTWQRWAACTPPDFRFSVKVPKTITHQAKLINTGALLQTFLAEVSGLGDKLGPLLIQLPPKLAFDEAVVHDFLTTFRELYPTGDTPGTTGHAVLEPRHASWFTPAVDRFLRGFEIARVAADPPKASPLAARPGGWTGLRYFRLHGAPRTYYSEYPAAFLKRLATQLREPRTRAAETWIIFDNTALGHATANALQLAAFL